MKLLGSTESAMTKDESGETAQLLKITKVVLVHCNFVNNDYQPSSRISFTFFPYKSFCQLLDILPKNFTFLF